jgi:uncharacterized protein (TIGR00730 family)
VVFLKKSNGKIVLNITLTNSMIVGIFCSSRASALVYEQNVILMMAVLASHGITKITYGGGNNGLMGVIYRESLKHAIPIVGHNLERWSLPHLDNEIIYSNLLDRQQGIMEMSDMYVILPGGIGTIYELTQTLCHNDVDRLGKPVVIYNIDHYYDTFLLFLTELINKKVMDSDRIMLHIVTTPEELQTLLILLHQIDKNESPIQSIV